MVSQMQSASMQQINMSAEPDNLSMMVWDVLVSVRLEIMMFIAAVVSYLVLFSSRVPKDVKNLKLKAKLSSDSPKARSPRQADEQENDQEATPKSFDSVDASLRHAVESGNHRAVLKNWNALKRFSQESTTPFSQVVESMQCVQKDAQFIVRELENYFKKHSAACNMCNINNIMESLGKRLDSQLMGMIVDMLPSLGLKQDARTYEIFLTMHATTRSFQEVQSLISEMQTKEVEFSTGAYLAVIKATLQTGNFEEARRHFSALKASWDSQGKWEVPRHFVAQLVDLACKEHQLTQFLPDLTDVPLPEEAINGMFSECIRLNDSELAREVEKLARAQAQTLSDATYSLLIKGLVGRPWRMKAVVQEVVAREPAEFSSDLAMAVINFCAKTSEKEIADTLFERMKPKQLNVLSAFIRFYVESEQFNQACDIFEFHVKPLSENESQKRSMIDSRVERGLMSAALHCGRTSLVQCLFDANKTDIATHIVMIRKCAAENNLKGSMSIFNSLKEGGVELNSIIYNTVLDACVKCRDLKAAEGWMKEIEEAGFADVVSFNTLIKAHLMQGNFVKARGVVDDMKKAGLQPNRVTYNELLNAAVVQSSRRSDIWDLVKEMNSAEVPPNQVTCSILLKSLNARSSETDILLTMDLIDSIDEPMDEILLSSVVEACVRIGKPDLLAKKLQQLEGKEKILLNGSHTCGSLIKAYGHAKDMDGVWRCWKEMRSKLIRPTSITLGCMVEAVVNNGDAEGAFDLIHQCLQDEQCRDAVNSILYCSVLKGFAREQRLQRVWDVYEEMRSRNMELSLIVFNTIIDACARTGHMDSLSKVLQDMKKHHVEPNIVTFSTIIKGHCQAGDVPRGFEVLKEMKRETGLKPDEIMYNSLLDGCAKNNLFDEGHDLLREMLKEGVPPSNFTLSIMVKLLNRARKIEQAFDLVHEVTRQYRFKPNVHVYTNLMQGCINSRQLSRALTVLQTMVKERVQPDCRVYAILIRACMYQEDYKQADSLLRAALGLPGAFDLPDARLGTCWTIDASLVNETLTSLADWGCSKSLAAPLLADIKKHKVKVNIDQGTQRRVTMDGVAAESPSPSKGKGKGKRNGW